MRLLHADRDRPIEQGQATDTGRLEMPSRFVQTDLEIGMSVVRVRIGRAATKIDGLSVLPQLRHRMLARRIRHIAQGPMNPFAAVLARATNARPPAMFGVLATTLGKRIVVAGEREHD